MCNLYNHSWCNKANRREKNVNCTQYVHTHIFLRGALISLNKLNHLYGCTMSVQGL